MFESVQLVNGSPIPPLRTGPPPKELFGEMAMDDIQFSLNPVDCP